VSLAHRVARRVSVQIKAQITLLGIANKTHFPVFAGSPGAKVSLRANQEAPRVANSQEVSKECRAKRRVSLLAEVSCQSQMSFGFGKTENISETGLLINLPETLPVDSEIEIRFVLAVRPQAVAIKTKGKVVWVRPRVAMGIQFLGLRDEDRDVITRFVEAASCVEGFV
jgi:hypothetical protein